MMDFNNRKSKKTARVWYSSLDDIIDNNIKKDTVW